MYKFLDIQKVPKPPQGGTEILNSLISIKETILIIEKFTVKKTTVPDGFASEFYHTLWDNIINSTQNLPLNRKGENISQFIL